METEEDLPPGFRRKTRSLVDVMLQRKHIDASLDQGKRKENFQSSNGVNTPTMKIRIRGEKIINPKPVVTPKIELTEDEEKGSIDAEIVSFHSGNEVYTLSKPPHLTSDVIRVDSPSILCVKNGLRSFLLTANPKNDVALMITQANNIFAFLQGLNAEYPSFYNNVRAYIRHCLEWYDADEELSKCKASEEFVSRYDQLVRQSIEAKNAVSVIEVDLVKVKMSMAPLKARVQDMKELLKKLEVELRERKTDLANLVAKKTREMEVIAATDVELKVTRSDAEKTRNTIRENIDRLEKARMCLEKARNQLEIM